MRVLENHSEPWKVTLIDTGEETMIGGRIKRILPFLAKDEAFCVTYGDGVSDINITESITFHRREGRLATVTATQPPGRFGAINYDGTRVTGFQEKPRGDGGWINGGFFVLSPKIGNYVEGDATIWEREPMINLAKDGQMSVFFHDGFLASDGYVARQAVLGRPLVEQQSSLEEMVTGVQSGSSLPLWRAMSAELSFRFPRQASRFQTGLLRHTLPCAQSRREPKDRRNRSISMNAFWTYPRPSRRRRRSGTSRRDYNARMGKK
ncbi:hypothetical protein ACVWXL_002336 [Bradyrhizobium sp. GM22.5]